MKTHITLALVTVTLAITAVLGNETHECLAGKHWLATNAGPALDEDSGRNLRNFPPDRMVDHLHLKLEMRFEDLEKSRFEATETLTVAAIGAPTEALTLDAVGLDIHAIRMDDGTEVEFFVDDEEVTMRFDPALEVGEDRDIIIEYTCEQPVNGMFFTPTSATVPSYTAEVHTQGQTTGNRHWFVTHDTPDERMTTELIVDVPAGYQVSSNGRLVDQTDRDDRAIWHWRQDKPHVAYLVSLIIGKFDVVELPHRRVPMSVWVPRGLGDQVKQTYGRTGDMIDLFERRFGVPYPWDRYDQLVVKNFGAGGMENTSATTMYPTAILDETALQDADIEGLIAHELAHQWSGDMITCKEWAHIWLNEGFATYGSALWAEYRDGEDGYLDSMRRSMRVARRDRTTDEIGMVSPVYGNPWEVFSRRGNPYPKGSSILHMLRRMLGEEVFWDGMHLYMNRHALGVVETNDFRYAMEEASGRGLEWFFDQWCFRPGSPQLDVEVQYDARDRELFVEVVQSQHIDERTPAFRFTLPVHVRTKNGVKVHEIDVDEKVTTFRTTLDGVPQIVAIDPYLHVLATVTVDKPDSMWTRQANHGPTIVARHRAIAALGEKETPDRRHRLVEIAGDGSVHRSLRQEAIDGLARYDSAAARGDLLALLDDGIADAKVRVHLVGKLGNFEAERDDVITRLAEIAGTDASYATRVAAIEGLAKHEAKDHNALLLELVEFKSQHDQVRRAALIALAELDVADALEPALKYAAYGYMDRARPAAINALGTLVDHDRDLAVDTLIGLLDDPQSRPARAAGRALADTGDERGLAPLKAMAESHPDPRRRTTAEGWVKTLEKKMKENEKKNAA